MKHHFIFESDTPFENRTGYTLVLGATRAGKTRLAELLTQDTHRGDGHPPRDSRRRGGKGR